MISGHVNTNALCIKYNQGSVVRYMTNLNMNKNMVKPNIILPNMMKTNVTKQNQTGI